MSVCVTALHTTCIYEPIHYYAHAVDRIARVVNEALRPILNEIKEDITSVKGNIARQSFTWFRISKTTKKKKLLL